MRLPENLREDLKRLPNCPGCYIFRNKQGEIIYIGKARSLRKRVRSYFRASTFSRADPKMLSLLKSVESIEIVPTKTEAQALITEDHLVKEHKPRFNVDLRDDKRFLLLKAISSVSFPYFKLCRIKRNDGSMYFGPYASAAGARATLDFVQKEFGIRSCLLPAPDEKAYRHCHDDIIRFCTAPCVGRIAQEDYRIRFDRACDFLRGRRKEELHSLRQRMLEAASRMDFEYAAALRDTLFLISRAIRDKAGLAEPQGLDSTATCRALDQIRDILSLSRRPKVIECFDVSCIAGTLAVGSMVCAINGVPHRNRYRRFRVKTTEGADDATMLAEVIERQCRRLMSEGKKLPDLILVDGGRVQMKAARLALNSVGAGTVPVAGIAKRFEDLYLENRSKPVRLPSDSPALKMLQRIRDEAHRFALSYHLSVRKKKIEESALDEIPGVGEVKKKLLMQRFGSVKRIAEATEYDIAVIPKIGYALARVIKQALGHHDMRQEGQR